MRNLLPKSSLIRMLAVFAAISAGSPRLIANTNQSDAINQARARVSNVLQKYCGDACELVNVDASYDQQVVDSEDLGFESISGESGTKTSLLGMTIDVQVDDRVTASDQERLGKLITNSVRSISPSAIVRWNSVVFPQIGVSAEVEDRLKQSVYQKIQSAVQDTIASYCPNECLLSSINVDGRLVSPDQARGVSERELVRERGGRGILRIENIDIDVSLDEKMPQESRAKIYNLIKAKTRFAFPVNINVAVVDFPEVAKSKEDRDPWNLDRLRQTLQIFRDLAGTKEIITNSTNNSTSNSNNKEQVERTESRDSRETSSLTSKEKTSASEKAISSTSEKSEAVTESEKNTQGGENTETMMYIAGFLVLAGILVALIMRFASASKDARIMLESLPSGGRGTSNQSTATGVPENNLMGSFVTQSGASSSGRENFSSKMRIEVLKEDLLRIFMDNPKVARDTFSRMIREEGVEQTAKYVNVFGPMIIFDLMSDPNLKRDLHDLGEYYYKASFAFNDDQILELLLNLKTKVTASEIRVMTHRHAEQFDFLQNLEATQIFTLISEEKPLVQSVVLTQLDHGRRRVVFDMYEGESKVNLMRELCRADAIPKEFLSNVAKALHKKVLSRTDFDTEQLRSSDIILDLLEKSTLQAQRELMADLVKTNPEAARAIKLKLVTVEMLPYIKDGHLLEIVMGLEREDLLAFLVGAPEHIRDLLLSKAPSELSQSWLEDIEQLSGIEEARYRLAEMRILGRVRNLANSGGIRLIDINDRIFAAEHLANASRSSNQVEMAVGNNFIAA